MWLKNCREKKCQENKMNKNKNITNSHRQNSTLQTKPILSGIVWKKWKEANKINPKYIIQWKALPIAVSVRRLFHVFHNEKTVRCGLSQTFTPNVVCIQFHFSPNEIEEKNPNKEFRFWFSRISFSLDVCFFYISLQSVYSMRHTANTIFTTV